MLRGHLIVFALAVAATLVAIGCGGDEEATTTTTPAPEETGPTGATGAEDGAGSAHVDRASGEFAGLALDERRGTPPPPVQTSDLDQAAEATACELTLDLPDEGNTHIPPSREPTYDTNPPTSGPHDPVPLADGAYLDQPEERHYVHSMEHGRVVIHYDPALPEEEQHALKGIFDEDPEGMILMPNADMPYEVAATAWRQLLGCDSYSPEVLDAIRAFRDEFRGKGPERIPL